MKKYDCIFLDRDGTISHDPYGYINSLSDYHFFDYAFEALEIFSKYTDKFIIVTNQSGLASGKIDIENLEEILIEKIDVSKILYCEKTNDLLFTKSQYLNDILYDDIFKFKSNYIRKIYQPLDTKMIITSIYDIPYFIFLIKIED